MTYLKDLIERLGKALGIKAKSPAEDPPQPSQVPPTAAG
jgi:hypothetical protein